MSNTGTCRVLVCVVYNVQDDLVNDGIDAMERELHRLTRVDAGVAARGKAPARAALSEAAGAETDAQAEIVQVWGVAMICHWLAAAV